MATNFSPCKGSYVLNQFPSNVMFAMNGFTYQPVERYRAIMVLLLSYEIRFVDDVISAYLDKERYLPNIFYALIMKGTQCRAVSTPKILNL